MGLSTCTKLQLIHCHAQEKTFDNRFLRNEIRIHSTINCKQMASVTVKMVDHLLSLQDLLEQHSQRHGHALHQETPLQDLLEQHSQRHGHALHQATPLRSHTAEH